MQDGHLQQCKFGSQWWALVHVIKRSNTCGSNSQLLDQITSGFFLCSCKRCRGLWTLGEGTVHWKCKGITNYTIARILFNVLRYPELHYSCLICRNVLFSAASSLLQDLCAVECGKNLLLLHVMFLEKGCTLQQC